MWRLVLPPGALRAMLDVAVVVLARLMRVISTTAPFRIDARSAPHLHEIVGVGFVTVRPLQRSGEELLVLRCRPVHRHRRHLVRPQRRGARVPDDLSMPQDYHMCQYSTCGDFVVELRRKHADDDTRGMKKEPTVRTTVLIPASLYEKIKGIAEIEQRSAHRQILYILERFVSEEERRPKEQDS